MRLFIAAELPEGEKRRLEKLREGIGDGFRSVPRENLHLTLKFLGEAPDARVVQVCDALKPLTWPTLTLRTEGLAFFPPRGRINVVAARLGGDVERLRQLHADIESALQPLGFPRDARPFAPHVTLMRCDPRCKPAGNPRQWAADNPAPAGPDFTMNSFALFQSHLKPAGPEYVPLARFSG
jgi:2'-5' RNA ligase